MTETYGANRQAAEADLFSVLLATHGPLMGGADLRRALGLPSPAAFRQARRRGQIGVAVFAVPHRKGTFALTNDVAHWLVGLNHPASQPHVRQEGMHID